MYENRSMAVARHSVVVLGSLKGQTPFMPGAQFGAHAADL